MAAGGIQQAQDLVKRQVYRICNIKKLKRYCVLGSESSSYRAEGEKEEGEKKEREKKEREKKEREKKEKKKKEDAKDINCVRALLDQGRYHEVIKILKEFSVSGKVAKEDPILKVLAICSVDNRDAVRKEALNAVVDICNIPTKLFRFLELSQNCIDKKRETSKPKPQPRENAIKRKAREEALDMLESLKMEEQKDLSEQDGPPRKKVKKKNDNDNNDKKTINPPGKKTSGWGRMRRKAIGKFYSDEKKNACRLLCLMTKYKQRHGWCHKDVLAYSHPKITGKHKNIKDLAIKYCTNGMKCIRNELHLLKTKPGIAETESLLVDYIEKLERVRNFSSKKDGDEDKLLEVLKTHGVRDQRNDLSQYSAEVAKDKDGLRCPVQIAREHIPSGFLNSKKVWEYLLQDMPMTALVRNLGKMTSLGLFDEQKNLDLAVESLTNAAKLKKAKVHPIEILIALETYRKGTGEKEYRNKNKQRLSWDPNQGIIEALDEAYYKSFMNVDLRDPLKTNKKHMLCLNISSSMFTGGCFGCETLSPALASFAMAWMTWNVEDDANVNVMAFGSTFEDLKGDGFNFRRDMKLDVVLEQARRDDTRNKVQNATQDVKNILQHIRDGAGLRPGGQYDSACDKILNATDKLFNSMGNAGKIEKQAKILEQATSQLVNGIKGDAEGEDDDDTQERLLAAAKVLADATEKLVEAAKITSSVPDCSLPMCHALEKGIEVDAFIIYTDNVPIYDVRTDNVPNYEANTDNNPINGAENVSVPINDINMDNVGTDNIEIDNGPINNNDTNNIPINDAEINNVDINYVEMVNVPINDVEMDNVPTNDVKIESAPINDADIDNVPINNVDSDNVNADNDTQTGQTHPAVNALREYNLQMQRDAKLIVVGMTSNGFSIADPRNPNMLDVVGFDTEVPNLISKFVRGEIIERCTSNCAECN